ncbi:hypothetical protein NFI95_13365 [Acetobacteraceae bacterium KSS8]|uniref:Uncharacterized protein n=1 Tax=Endosaccharibacter trunci TaxID=2812733 RepID=A0ABT1W973_9PROT|nr:hypothetical protein [Acetobacteraceae bacterium KSS8]
MPAPAQTTPPAKGGTPDFNLPPPAGDAQTSGPAAPAQTGAPSAANQTQTIPQTQTGQTIDAATLPGEAALSTTSAVAGGAILLVLAVGLFFVRGAIRSHLISLRASPSAAGSAGWALFALLLGLCVLVLFGLLGNLWGTLAFTLPLGLFILLMLVLFVLLYRAAKRGRQLRPRA